MPAFVIRFQEPADLSGNPKEQEDVYSVSYDNFHELYVITTTFSNSHMKSVSMNTLSDVKQFLHAMYKYVNLDTCVKSGNYISTAQIDGGMFPTIKVHRRDLLDADVIQTLDQALDVWATITVPGIELYKIIRQYVSAPVTQPTPIAQCKQASCEPRTCCQSGGLNYGQNHHLFI